MKSSNHLHGSFRSFCVRLGGASFACALAFACNGQLEVGDKDPPAESSAGAAGISDSPNESQGGAAAGGTSKGGAATGGVSMSPGGRGSGGFGAQPSNGAAVGSGGTPEPPPEEVGVIQGGSSEGCPEEQPATLDACAESLICGYRAPSGSYEECTCSEIKEGERGWNCVRSGLSFGLGCPTNKPKQGESCFGSFDSRCEYPGRTSCFCSSEIQTWDCQDGSAPEHLAHPGSVGPEVPIDELTDEQRDAWCSWYAQAARGPGFPPPPDVPVDAEGYTTNSGCSFSHDFPCRARWPQLSARQCAQNLALSACSAPIAELSDCIATLNSGCQPSPNGCPRYLEKPGCAGTIVLAGYPADGAMMSPDRNFDCPLRVE